MAVIAQTVGVSTSTAPINLTRTTLAGPDTLTFVRGAGQMLILNNTTAAAITVSLVGTAPENLNVPGFGGSISTSGGKSVNVPANGTSVINLDALYGVLAGSGTVTITNGLGLQAVLFV